MQDQTVERVIFQLLCACPVSLCSQETALEWLFISSISHVSIQRKLCLPAGR